ncbi:aminotransferase [Bacillus sp. TS-2]|nr:aminotransferase [Bacillus sp. TS-2]
MMEAVNEYSANPGRSGHHLSQIASQKINETRKELATMFGAPSPKHVWFYQNATMALNQALSGFPFQEGEHVVTTAFEHNSVLRPLYRLTEQKKIDVTYVEPNEDGLINENEMEMVITAKTRMIVVSHASNVTGSIVPLRKIATIAKTKGIVLLVDASQTAGTIPINMENDDVDLLAFAGHKGMLGPQGTAVLMSRKDFSLEPIITGGTGGDSELPGQPSHWPERYEAGTLNTPGIIGLHAGLQFIKKQGIEQIHEHEKKLLELCMKELESINGLTLYGTRDLTQRVAVISFRMEQLDSQELAIILDEHYKIAVRAGLHCAPKTHHSLASIDSGLVRVSFGPYNTEEEVKQFINAMKAIGEAFILAGE